jgi:hypothetical protein
VTYGPTFIQLELGAVVGLVAENRIQDIAGTFLQLMLATAQAGLQWLQQAVSSIPEACATSADKQFLVQRISQACALSAASLPELDQAIWCASLRLQSAPASVHFPASRIMMLPAMYNC